MQNLACMACCIVVSILRLLSSVSDRGIRLQSRHSLFAQWPQAALHPVWIFSFSKQIPARTLPRTMVPPRLRWWRRARRQCKIRKKYEEPVSPQFRRLRDERSRRKWVFLTCLLLAEGFLGPFQCLNRVFCQHHPCIISSSLSCHEWYSCSCIYVTKYFVPNVMITMHLSHFYTSNFNDKFSAIFYYQVILKMPATRHIRRRDRWFPHYKDLDYFHMYVA